MTAPTSVEQIINMALDMAGYPEYIGNIYEGTKEARIALNLYGQTRDSLLADGNWEFAERNTQGILLKQAPNTYLTTWSPTYPPQPWRFEYVYPADALKIRAVKSTVVFVPNFDPQPWPYSVDNDSSFSPPQRVILSQVPNALIVYTGRVVDPTTWDVLFLDEFIDELAKRMAPALKLLEGERLLVPEKAQAELIAKGTQE
jgi:hypothetical protein